MHANEEMIGQIKQIKEDSAKYVLDFSHLHAVLDNFTHHLNYSCHRPFDATMLDEVLAQILVHKGSLAYHSSACAQSTHWADLTQLEKNIQDLLNPYFKPIELISLNDFDRIEDIPSEVLAHIRPALECVYASPLRHQRLCALRVLEGRLYVHRNAPAFFELYRATQNMIKVMMNAVDDQDLANKLAIRDKLLPYYPKFVTMPPQKTPAGKVLRELLQYEENKNSDRVSHQAGVIKKSLRSENRANKQHLLTRTNRALRERLDKKLENSPKDPLKNKRKAYHRLLLCSFFRAIGQGDIRPIDFDESVKNKRKGKIEYSELELESKRLYPYTKTRMLLQLDTIGHGNNQTLRFYPFRTQGMSINRHIHNRAMFVIDERGNFFADSTSPLVVHSSLAVNCFFAGYIKSHYGYWTELGTYCGSFKTNEQNALNCYRYLCKELALYDADSHPIFYLDNRHSTHLLKYVIEHHRDELYELIYNKKHPRSITLSESFDSLAEFLLDREALQILNAQKAMKSCTAYPTTKPSIAQLGQGSQALGLLFNNVIETRTLEQAVKQQIEQAIKENLIKQSPIELPGAFFPVLVYNKENVNQLSYELRKNKSSESNIYSLESASLYQEAFFFQEMVKRGFERYKTEIVLLGCRDEDRYPTIENALPHFDDSIHYQEHLHGLKLQDLAISRYRIHHFICAPTNQDRLKTTYQHTIQSLMNKQYLGTLLASLIYGLYNLLYFSFSLGFYPYSFVLCANVGITFCSLAIDSSSIDTSDLTTGWNNSSILNILVYLLASTAIPVPTAIGGGHVLCALLGLLGVGISVALILQVIKASADQLNLNLSRSTTYSCQRDEELKALAQSTVALIKDSQEQRENMSPRAPSPLFSFPLLRAERPRGDSNSSKRENLIEIAPASREFQDRLTSDSQKMTKQVK